MATHYDTLQVAESADEAVIRASYRVLIQRYHPDKFTPRDEAERRTVALNAAYAVLSDAERRARYDEVLAHARSAAKESAEVPKPTPAPPSPPPPASPAPVAASGTARSSTVRWALKLLAMFIALKLIGVAGLVLAIWLWLLLKALAKNTSGKRAWVAAAALLVMAPILYWSLLVGGILPAGAPVLSSPSSIESVVPPPPATPADNVRTEVAQSIVDPWKQPAQQAVRRLTPEQEKAVVWDEAEKQSAPAGMRRLTPEEEKAVIWDDPRSQAAIDAAYAAWTSEHSEFMAREGAIDAFNAAFEQVDRGSRFTLSGPQLVQAAGDLVLSQSVPVARDGTVDEATYRACGDKLQAAQRRVPRNASTGQAAELYAAADKEFARCVGRQ